METTTTTNTPKATTSSRRPRLTHDFEPALCSAAEAAALLGVTMRQLQRWIDAGQFGPQPARLAGIRRYGVAEIRMWVLMNCPSVEEWAREWPKIKERVERAVVNRGGRTTS